MRCALRDAEDGFPFPGQVEKNIKLIFLVFFYNFNTLKLKIKRLF